MGRIQILFHSIIDGLVDILERFMDVGRRQSAHLNELDYNFLSDSEYVFVNGFHNWLNTRTI
ncbi:MAG TPA: hypothetical protein PLF65_02635 [Desulfobacter postgatei]|uniref:hypothetical protein n=1 Tax=Desulfobacter sp. TaxID=2294 RepID=UPI001B4DB9B0|nr:hypothetical protein [Desulfobacter sp.]MBP8830397.1 hypothetical protein [Desulfobacter sp.]HRF89677.1 hypothetical protein [Desulfobacter postgatei]